jgi:hypothetical protein
MRVYAMQWKLAVGETLIRFSHLAASDSMDLSISQVSQWNESTYLSPIQEQKIQ